MLFVRIFANYDVDEMYIINVVFYLFVNLF